MRELYKEGRIVGPSSYELYVRRCALANLSTQVITEKEYLASLMSSESSMILKIASGTAAGYHDFILPINSKLCGCTFVKAFMFEGQATLDSSNIWATNILDYGRLISNDEIYSPVTPGESEDVPAKNNTTDITDELFIRYRNYLKVTGGRVFQPGEWVTVSEEQACKQLHPDLNEAGFIRIVCSEDIECDLYIMLTGFSNKDYLRPVNTNVYQLPTNNTEEGDFLGAINYPWACPIEFLVTNAQLLRWERYVEAMMQLLDERSQFLMRFHLLEDQEEG